MKMPKSLRRVVMAAALCAAVAVPSFVVAGCGGEGSSSSGASPSASSAMASGTIIGAGASFPAPLYTRWGSDYQGVAGTKLNYQSVGSGAGISAIKAKTVDFGASDAPLDEKELKEAGLAQFPMTVGGVVVVVNIKGVKDGQLRLTSDVLASIYMGKTTKWNDPTIAKINSGVTLPDTKISVVHRSDSSGTSWIFTNYLDAAAGKVWTAGAGKEVPWPAGVGGKGNEGVAASVQQLNGAIGYVEYAYAAETGMTTVQMKNKSGAWVKPSIKAFTAATATADWKGSLPSMALVLVDQKGKDAWPITGASFILVHKEQQDAARATEMFKFFDWCYANGENAAGKLNYVAIPASVYKIVQDEVWSGITAGGSPVV